MVNARAALYLPITEVTYHEVVDDENGLDKVLTDLSVPEVGALFFLSHLPKLVGTPSASVERTLAKTLNVCTEQVKEIGQQAFVVSARDSLSQDHIRLGHAHLSGHKIELLDEESQRQEGFLDSEGQWDFNFTQAHQANLESRLVTVTRDESERLLTSEQSRLYQEYKYQKDEHTHIQGYAGTGKTSMVEWLLSMHESSGARILVLAEHKRQLDALLKNAPRMEHVDKCTFVELADQIIPPDMTSSASSNIRNRPKFSSTMPDSELIENPPHPAPIRSIT